MGEDSLETRMARIEEQVKSMRNDLNKVSSSMERVVWIILAAVVLAVLGLVMTGGASADDVAEPQTASTMRLLDSSGTRT